MTKADTVKLKHIHEATKAVYKAINSLQECSEIKQNGPLPQEDSKVSNMIWQLQIIAKTLDEVKWIIRG